MSDLINIFRKFDLYLKDINWRFDLDQKTFTSINRIFMKSRGVKEVSLRQCE